MSNEVNHTIIEKLSRSLNKPVNESLSKTVKTQALSKNLEEFTKFLQVIGLKNENHAKDIFDYVNAHVSWSMPTPLETKKVVRKSNKVQGLRLSYEDMSEEEEKEEKEGQEEEKTDTRIKPVFEKQKEAQEGTARPKFKRIKVEEAARLKQAQPATQILNGNEMMVPTKEPKLEVGRNNKTVPRPMTHRAPQKNNSIPLAKPITPSSKTFNESSRAATGGYFDAHGKYIDNDHASHNDFNRISIVSHVFIPPFLEKSKEFLTLQISGTSVKGIGPTINPIKNLNSELASMARQGSLVTQNRRSKQERAKQAKESTGAVTDTADNKQDDKTEGENYDDQGETIENINEQRRNLPAFTVKDDVVTTIRDNQVTIIIGETGSGKTTQLTQYLFEAGFASIGGEGSEKKVIACTQPRRVAATSVAKRVSKEMQVELGEEVGYSVRFDDKTNPKKTVIKYMTEGILLREMLADPLLSEYSCIIMDEAHERSLNTDILLGLFKSLLAKRRDLKLVVTSATMNADRFTRFFGAAPQFSIPGRTYQVEIYYNKNVIMDYVENAVKQILSIHLGNSIRAESKSFVNDGDILVFMTGQEDIEVTCDLLREKLDMLENPPPLDIMPIYSSMPPEQQRKIFRKKDASRRKVVVATNIAETSLTVDGVKYVIDCGLVKQKVYNSKLGMDTLQVVPISMANAQQRSGRAGRTSTGIAYRLYTENATNPNNMYEQPIPEIQRTNLSNTMLLLKSLRINDINSFPFLDPPPKDLLNCSLYDLWAINALDNFGELTELGRGMIQFPLEPTLSKLILLSTQHEFHCSEEIVTIVAMLSVPGIFQRSKERAHEADFAREKFTVAESDHLTLLNVYCQWDLNLQKFGKNWSKINQWCEKNFLHCKSLYQAREIRSQILQIMQKNKLPVLKSPRDENVRKCLCAAYYQQSAKLVKTNVNGAAEFMNLRHSYMNMYLHPTSSLLNCNLSSNFVIFHELILTSKEYMNCVTCVDPMWLLQYGYKFFGVPETEQNQLVNSQGLITKERFAQQLDQDRVLFEEKKTKEQKKPGNRQHTELKKRFLVRKRF
ncbi:hypothetical protein KGF56_000919 [Candida oxycetoniae]|uniref:RNA helicase n=1 Tax=Candida oxycetoniae TaxID=497107 RepID=A0AAI9T0B6_9ASCO|nr:uncharacterized protein KGF56_000919 [Candida oxycetoniae]KAI3406438.2 hypothetical protein KGF56_000919 [Candida oxycetoniae]